MINPVSSAVLTGGIVATDNLLGHHQVSFRQLAGVGIYLIFLALINESNPKLAATFGFLVLITTTFLYVPRIVTYTGVAR